MKKETLLEIILGTVGGLVFSIGMCMCLIPEWDLLKEGVIVAIIGFIILLCIIPIYKKDKPKKMRKNIDLGILLTFVIGIFGSLILGFGMSKIMVLGSTKTDLIIGMITGVIGLLICVLNYPVYSYLKTNEKNNK